MAEMLITRPEHDPTTHYLSNWSKEVIELAESKNIKVFDLNREKAIRKNVGSRLDRPLCNLTFFNGHGNFNMITGHNNKPIIIGGENENWLKSKIVYAISCKSAMELGPKSINAGAIAYTGFDDDFIFVYEPENISRPLHDNTAKLFLEPSQLFIKSLIKGNSVKEGMEKTKKLLTDNLLKALSNNDTSSAKYLWWNLKHFVSHGNLDAKL
jgi:hypothetical protein